ncbi:hypothetical protein HQ545_02790, partial [Candidatus Woesearchaeota archaeon]|nr:hypothetical protein [Candidatus Woesearchaeota archaeon]
GTDVGVDADVPRDVSTDTITDTSDTGNQTPFNPTYTIVGNLLFGNGTSITDEENEISLTGPSENPDYTGEIPTQVRYEVILTNDKGTPTDTSDDETQRVIDEILGLGLTATGNVDTTGMRDGEGLTIEGIISAEVGGERYSVDGSVETNYEEMIDPDALRILDNWDLDMNNFGGNFDVVFNVVNYGENMEYSIRDLSPDWFARGMEDYFIRGPPEDSFGELDSDVYFFNRPGEWGDCSVTIVALNTDTGETADKTVDFPFDRYMSALIVDSAGESCRVEVHNSFMDYAFAGIDDYVPTTNTDGSAVGITEVNMDYNPADLGIVVGRLRNTSDEDEIMIRHYYQGEGLSNPNPSWTCVEDALERDDIQLIQADVYVIDF